MKRARKTTAGRPKDMDKRAAIAAAAQAQFLARGFDRASMDEIAAKAGVSKLTVYGHFKDKDTLFRQVMHDKISRFRIQDDLTPLLAMQPREGLLKIAREAARIFFSAEMVQLQRLMESSHSPKFSQAFYSAGIERFRKHLAKYLRDLDKAGRLIVPQPERAAQHFFSLLRGDLYIRAALGLGLPSPAAMNAQAKEAVEVFLRAYPAPAKKAKKK
jgi:TetR/AcrR family transcriptional repressor of mexJK operon